MFDYRAAAVMGLLVFWADKIHVFFTFAKVDLQQDIGKTKATQYRIYSLLALCLLFTYFAFFTRGLVGIQLFVMYFAIFHFCRQQFGWIKIINKNIEISATDARVSELMVHVYCLIPILIAHSKEFYFNWLSGVPNLFSIPDSFVRPILMFYVPILIAYFLYELHGHLTHRIPFNLTRISTILFTAVGWNVAILFRNWGYSSAALLLVGHHVLSYLFLVYFFNVENRKQKRSVFLFYSVLFLFTLLTILTLRNSLPNFTPKPAWTFAFSFSSLQQSYIYYLIPLFWIPTIFHFVLDGFVWKGTRISLEAVPSTETEEVEQTAAS